MLANASEETTENETPMSDTSSRGWQPATYYPDPAIHALDPRFEKYWIKLGAIERIATGMRWAEGPIWFGDGRYLLCSDIPNNRIIKWEEETGAVSDFRKPSNYGNGNTRDRQGRLITCEHGRRITRTEYDGSITVLMDNFEGKKLNSPNDVVVKSDGSIWFTDPPFGLMSDYEGNKAPSEIGQNIYRIDGDTLKSTIVADDVLGPNGLCFSPDEKLLYVVESRGVPNRKILAYDVAADSKTLKNKRVLIDAGPGTPDGMRCDIDGNLWCGWGIGKPELDGVFIFAPDGEQIGRIALPERCANVCFGGVKRNRLFHGIEPVDLCGVCKHAGGVGGLTGTPPSQRHCERSEAIQSFHACGVLDCRVASLLAMTAERPS
jgi:gluconolactonase